jgi:hypothetical protein
VITKKRQDNDRESLSVIHNILLVKNERCIFNYKTGTKKSLDEEMFSGLLDTMFQMGRLVLEKRKINKISFHDVRAAFQPISREIFIGIVEDAEKKLNTSDGIDLLLKDISTAIHPIISILEQKRINPDAIGKIPWIEEEITKALEKAIHKISCPYLKKKRIGNYCNFIKGSIRGKYSTDICNLRDVNNCKYLKDESYYNEN